MIKACNLKKGNVVRIDGQIYKVKHIFAQSPSARGANTLYKVRFAQIQTQQKHEMVYKGEDIIEEVDLDRRSVQYLFNDGENYTFMDNEDYTQFALSNEELEGLTDWIYEDMEDLSALFLDGNVLGVTIPDTVELEIVETAPAMKSASATSRNKPATLSTGAVVQVPEYLSEGEVIKVNTENGKYISRA